MYIDYLVASLLTSNNFLLLDLIAAALYSSINDIEF